MPGKKLLLDRYYLAALQFKAPADRAEFLDKVCAGDADLRRQLEDLLARAAEVAQTGVMPNAPAESVAGEDTGNTDPTSAEVTQGQSVLDGLTHLVGDVPRVNLRRGVNENDTPVVRATSSEIPTHQSLGRYRIDGEIARGGMGAILKGRDTDLGRDLAIKVLLESHRNRPEVVGRFIEEAQIAGQLQHPGITPVYELGQFPDARPFFTMKLVKGQTLSALLSRRANLAEDRPRFIGIFQQICQTMAYAHSRGVIHRDLKPSNVMVGAFGEVQVMDWGLAKVLSAGGVDD